MRFYTEGALFPDSFSHFKKNKKMTRVLLFFTVLLGITTLTSCASMKQNAWLKEHHNQLVQAAASNASAEEKVDIMLTNYADLMEEGLRFVNPIKGAKHIQKYQEQNAATIEKIVANSNSWMNGLNDQQTVMLGFRVVKKPYIKRIIDLVPKFQRKYEQYKFVADMTGKVARGFGNVGGKLLGL
jgi:hypothetical protein